MFFRSISRKHKRLLFFLSRKFFFVHPFVLIFPVCECLGSIARLPAAFREMSLHSCSLRPQGSLCSKRFGLVSERRKTDERQGTGNESSLPPSSFTRPIFRAVFDSRNLFFAPKPHGNEPQGTKPHPLERRPIDDRIDRSPDGAYIPWRFFIEWVPFLF